MVFLHVELYKPKVADQAKFFSRLGGRVREIQKARGLSHVRTRSTQSSHRAYAWLIHGYQVNERVKVLYNPNGPDIKIAGESILASLQHRSAYA